jgi:hypothetical protein
MILSRMHKTSPSSALAKGRNQRFSPRSATPRLHRAACTSNRPTSESHHQPSPQQDRPQRRRPDGGRPPMPPVTEEFRCCSTWQPRQQTHVVVRSAGLHRGSRAKPPCPLPSHAHIRAARAEPIRTSTDHYEGLCSNSGSGRGWGRAENGAGGVASQVSLWGTTLGLGLKTKPKLFAMPVGSLIFLTRQTGDPYSFHAVQPCSSKLNLPYTPDWGSP